ncbi:defective chorion protein, FC106 isoform isoform X2 [Drosophila bipectinata]|uniref:defective chorion protein, FC106 isoform isoform X2 n=1 Tax=Drosophila bipectinata TaxID=42026 RepID=UPI0038B3C1A6
MRSHSQMLLLLALLSVQVAVHVSGQSPAEVPPQATITSGSEATQALDDIEQEAARTKANESTQFIRPRFPSQDEILSQMGPPIQPFATNLPALDAFYMMFPALGSLLRWGSVFPMGSLLGAVPDTLLQPTGAASKVVLVLADDAAAKTRVPRQDSPPAPANPLDWAANVGQMITNMQANPLLPTPSFDATLGAPLQNLLPLNGLPGLGLLGQAAPAPAAPADPPATPAPVEDTPARAAAPPAFPGLPNLPSFDPAVVGQSITSMLSQAPPNLLSQLPPMPQIPQLQQFAQFLPQIPGLSQAPVGQASDISEVRVRPEIPYVTGTPQMKIKTALEKEQESRREQELYQEQNQERVPLLWFRLPVGQGRDTQGKPIEDLRVEAKLKAFERQVITELKMLQQIERMAKEMRTSATTGAAAQSSDYRVNYPLNHTPVHKITRADIEQALRDDYVRRLVQKEAQRRGFINRKTGGFKRQTFTEDKNLSKEDIVQIMAYAYRMANEQMAEAEKSKQDKVYAAYRSPAERQWSEDQAKNQPIQQQRQMIQQNPMMMPQQRQMGEIPQAPSILGEQQRQWSERQANQQMIQQNQMIQKSPMMMQQRQWTEEQAKQQAIQQNTMMMQQQRQWTEEQAKIQQERQWTEDQAKQQAILQNPAMMQQRQWTEDHAKQQQEAMMQQQRQWTEEQARQQTIPHQQAAIQQGPMMMQRQWTEEEAKTLQDQQTLQQRQMSDERQWADEKAKAQQQQAIQMGQAPIQMDQGPILQQMHQPMMQQRMEQLLTHNPPTNIGHPEEDDEDATMLGEAGPQMPENEGTARHKVDPLGLGGNKRKKSKSRRPAVVNYYYPAPQPQYQVPQYQVPQYQVPQYQAPSYGTSYGGGGYGSNAYGSGGYAANSYQRAAVGNDEVDDMLRRHQTLARATHFRQ